MCLLFVGYLRCCCDFLLFDSQQSGITVETEVFVMHRRIANTTGNLSVLQEQ
jgi:hypothetical protein